MSAQLSSEDVAYVRREKKADEEIQQKLTQVYGAAPRQDRDSRLLKRGWTCASCGYVNYEARIACGECLDIAPGAKNTARRNEKLVGVSQDPGTAVLQIGDRCYRTFSGPIPGARKHGGNKASFAPTPAQVLPSSEVCEDDDDDGGDCGQQSGGAGAVHYDDVAKHYTTTVQIPSVFLKFLIGAKGATLQETQRLTGATIILPRDVGKEGEAAATTTTSSSSSAGDGDVRVTIRAAERGAILAAQIRLDSIMLQVKDKISFTHFASIPLGTIPSVASAATKLLRDVQEACCDAERHIDPSILQSATRLHISVAMLRLQSQHDLERAKSLLAGMEKEIQSMFSDAMSRSIQLSGLHYMNDDPTDVHVLYLGTDKATPSSVKLRQLIARVNDVFLQAGLVSQREVARTEVIHVTLMNSKWRDGDNANSRVAFDATQVLQLFGGVSLGMHSLQRIELNRMMGSAQSGYYPAEHVVTLQ